MMKELSLRLTAGLLSLFFMTAVLCRPASASTVRADTGSGAVRAAAPADPAPRASVSSDSLVRQKELPAMSAEDAGLQWQQFEGGIRIQEASNGKYRKGFVRYKGRLYYFDSKGYLKTGFFKVDGKTYYASCVKGSMGKGQILTGLWKIGRYFYYLDPSSKPNEGVVSTGFHKVRGHTYYFDKKGRMVTGWFKVHGDKYYASCNKSKGFYGALLKGIQKIGNTVYRLDEYSGKLLGKAYHNSKKYMHVIDVSEHNGNVDFEKVRESGVEAVMIRAGYGKSDVDKTFYANIKNARDAGLRVGVYWFSYAKNTQDAIKEANFCLDVLKDWRLNLPVYFDWEEDSMSYAREHGAHPNRTAITEMTEAFCNTIARSGRRAGYYSNLSYLKTYYNTAKLQRFSVWYAFWGNNLSSGNIWIKADMMAAPRKYDMWQFSAVGKVPGISGPVDCDLLLDPSILK